MMSERIAESAEEIDALMQRYSDIGMLAISSDSVVSLRYDQAGNELKVIVHVGERIRCQLPIRVSGKGLHLLSPLPVEQGGMR